MSLADPISIAVIIAVIVVAAVMASDSYDDGEPPKLPGSSLDL